MSTFNRDGCRVLGAPGLVDGHAGVVAGVAGSEAAEGQQGGKVVDWGDPRGSVVQRLAVLQPLEGDGRVSPGEAAQQASPNALFGLERRRWEGDDFGGDFLMEEKEVCN